MFEKFRVLPYPTFGSFDKFLWKFQFSFAYLVRQCCFLCFFIILRGKVASGCLKLILSCMHDVRTAVLHWGNQMNKVLNGEKKRRQNFLSFSFSIIIKLFLFRTPGIAGGQRIRIKRLLDKFKSRETYYYLGMPGTICPTSVKAAGKTLPKKTGNTDEEAAKALVDSTDTPGSFTIIIHWIQRT